MRKLTSEKHSKYAKVYKDYIYTFERLHNTKDGHPNYEIVVYPINKMYETLGTRFHYSGYEQLSKHIEAYIEKEIILKGGEM